MFFCKQKTAYEVRISDWSSDVCSSDLAGRLLFCRGGCCRDQGCSRLCPYGRGACQTDRLDEKGRRGAGGRSDRKSVVEGKGVSGRLDPGGRRLNKQKKKDIKQIRSVHYVDDTQLNT